MGVRRFRGHTAWASIIRAENYKPRLCPISCTSQMGKVTCLQLCTELRPFQGSRLWGGLGCISPLPLWSTLPSQESSRPGRVRQVGLLQRACHVQEILFLDPFLGSRPWGDSIIVYLQKCTCDTCSSQTGWSEDGSQAGGALELGFEGWMGIG